MSNLFEKVERLSSSQRLLLALDQAVAKLEAAERFQNEPIAIVGMGCRYPGGVHDPESYWQLLQDGIDAIVEVPSQRWDIDRYYDPDPAALGKMYVRVGGFLQQVDQFDTQFFNISPREALNMDPQQRLLLEVSWETLERAGYIRDRLIGTQTGVFVGVTNSDYGRLLVPNGDLTQLDTYFTTGNTLNAAAGRLSYILGLTGPSMAIDTACSSSLVTVHLACQSLRHRDCDLALAGGVNLLLLPETTVALCRTQVLSPDGRCKTFDAEANGMVRGEGCGVILLKRFSDAVADRDNILAVIRGSAVNQDGSSSGLTVPNGVAQEALLREALSRAKVDPSEVSYVEAHGTGTTLGDPIEVRALGSVLCAGRSKDNPLTIGTVKSNIGHLESASGIAGLMKVVLALQHKEIPPNLHFKKPSPYINWDLPIVVPTERTPWKVGEKHRIAGVSSFGLSGTNAHIVLEEAPALPLSFSSPLPLHLLTLSAKTRTALEQLIARYQQHLQAHPDQEIADICFTTNTGRAHFSHRLSVVARDRTEMSDKLATFATRQETLGVYTSELSSTAQPKIAFLFTGQGSQYVGMGRELYETQPTFRTALDRCDEILRSYLEDSLLKVLFDENLKNQLNETAYTQPALFAIEYALCQLWKSWGVHPSVVVGHSIGEYVAATVAGVFSLEDGLKLIATRGKLMQALPRDGAMVVLMANEAVVRAAIAPLASSVAIAAINGPNNIVISGKREATASVSAKLEEQGVKATTLQVSHAFHSPLMQPILEEFERVANSISYSAPEINLISNVTGQVVISEVTNPKYWCQHIIQPVQFATGIASLQQQECEVWLEVGPKPILLGMGRQCLPLQNVEKVTFLPSLRPGQSDWQQMLQSLAQLYVSGANIDWVGFERDYQHQKVVLPTYPFQRQSHWVEIEHQEQSKNGTVSSESVQTSMVNLLNQGDTNLLIEHLVKESELSEDEVKFLPKLLDLLVKHHKQQVATNSFQDWFYQIEWRQQPRTTTLQSTQPNSWLIFADQGGVGQTLAQYLQQQNHECFLIYAGDSYCQKSAETWSINPSSPDEFQQLIQEVKIASRFSLKVIHLWGLEAVQTDELTLMTLEEVQKLTCGSVLHLLQALLLTPDSTSKSQFASKPRLWLVTQNAVPVDSSSIAVAQAPLWGLGKVVSLEHPELWGGLLDLGLQPNEEDLKMLLAEIEDSQAEDCIALRSGQRYVARLVHSQSLTSQDISLRSDSTYLVTGGLGGLGLTVAQWMVKQGVRHLVLVGRRKPSDLAQQSITRMEELGAKVLAVQADVSHQDDMVGLLEEVTAFMPPVRGVIHAAGVLSDGMLQQQTWERFSEVMAPKILGTWNLHLLTQNLPLDFFICFSSAAAMLGSPGQSNYAAANAFMDSLSHYRRSLGMPSLSINWGSWTDTGMAANLHNTHSSRLASRGMSPLEPEQGLKVLEQLLGQPSPQVGVLSINWSKFKQQFPSGKQPSLLSELLQKAGVTENSQQGATQYRDLLQRLQLAPSSARQKLLSRYIQEEVAKVLGLGRSQLPNPKQNFFDMGMDSLTAVELKNLLERHLEQSLSSTLVFNYPNIEALVQYLLQEVLALEIDLEESIDLQESQEELAALEEIKQLSESDIMALIAEEFESASVE